MSIEEAAELARRSIYHATFRDGASGGVASGTLSLSLSLFVVWLHTNECTRVYVIKWIFVISLLCGANWVEEAVWG